MKNLRIQEFLDERSKYICRGNAKVSLKNYQGAIADYSRAIEINPDCVEAYNNRGNAKLSLKDYHGAIADCNKAIEISPDCVEAYFNRGNAKYFLKDYQGAVADYNKAIEYNPDDAGAYNNRGNAKMSLKDYQGAVADYNKAIEYNPDDAGAYNNRGNAKMSLKNYQGAIADYSKAIEINPNHTKAYNNREIAKQNLKNYKITFNSLGGSAVASQNVGQGNKLTRPANPTRPNYVFVGWHTDQACTNLWNFNTDVVTANTVLYAKWVPPHVAKAILEKMKKRKYLFFDTETIGLPNNWKAPVTDLNNWPRLVQLAFLLYDYNGNKISGGDFIIKPDGFSIPLEASRVHGITTDRALMEGVPIDSVLRQFNASIQEADYLVAHNMAFDEKIVGAEFLRNGMPNPIPTKNKICTMERTTDFCAIDGPYGYKWPKLSELHHKLFGVDFEEAHNASVDINATAKCFWELRKRGKI